MVRAIKIIAVQTDLIVYNIIPPPNLFFGAGELTDIKIFVLKWYSRQVTTFLLLEWRQTRYRLIFEFKDIHFDAYC